MTKLEFLRMCYLDYTTRILLLEGLTNTINERGQANVGGIVLTSALRVEALIRLVMANGEAGFDMSEI